MEREEQGKETPRPESDDIINLDAYRWQRRFEQNECDLLTRRSERRRRRKQRTVLSADDFLSAAEYRAKYPQPVRIWLGESVRHVHVDELAIARMIRDARR